MGVEFAGKKAVTNGKLCVNFHNNNITGVQYGINMYHPNVICFNLTNCNIKIDAFYALLGYYAIQTNVNYNATGYVGVYNSNFVGNISSIFNATVGTHRGNNTGFP